MSTISAGTAAPEAAMTEDGHRYPSGPAVLGTKISDERRAQLAAAARERFGHKAAS